jgi:hypothetical protein
LGPETKLRDGRALVKDDPLPEQTCREIIRMTRVFTQYGISGFAVLFIIVGAVEALFGR